MLLQIRYVLSSYLLIQTSSIDALHHIVILQLKDTEAIQLLLIAPQ